MVSDQGNNRVLEFANPVSTHSTVANEVFGQGGNFTTNGCNQIGANADSLCTPKDLTITIDGSGNLYIADWSNARVLEFNTPLSNTTATRRLLS